MPPRLTQGVLIAVVFASSTLVARAGDDQAVDPVGAWKLKCVSPDGKARECVVTLSREGKTLRGIYKADGKVRPAKDVAFDRGLLSFRVEGEFAGQTYGLTYRGKPAGNLLRGSVRWKYGWASGSFAFEGERLTEQVASAR